jgi:hypothetical protein
MCIHNNSNVRIMRFREWFYYENRGYEGVSYELWCNECGEFLRYSSEDEWRNRNEC